MPLIPGQTCADPGIFVRGVQFSLTKKSSDNVFFFFFFFKSSAYFTEVKWSISKKSITFQGSRGGPTFSRGGGGPTFSRGGGSNCLFPLETHITCDFPGGIRTPCPPLWIRTCQIHIGLVHFKHLHPILSRNAQVIHWLIEIQNAII